MLVDLAIKDEAVYDVESGEPLSMERREVVLQESAERTTKLRLQDLKEAFGEKPTDSS